MSEEEAKKLVRDAIAAGIFNDLGSGSNVDLCVIRKNYSLDYLRGYEYANLKGVREVNILILISAILFILILFLFSFFLVKLRFRKGNNASLKDEYQKLRNHRNCSPYW